MKLLVVIAQIAQKSKVGAVPGSVPTLSFTFILVNVASNNQGVVCIACFSLFYILYVYSEPTPWELDPLFLNFVVNLPPTAITVQLLSMDDSLAIKDLSFLLLRPFPKQCFCHISGSQSQSSEFLF